MVSRSIRSFSYDTKLEYILRVITKPAFPSISTHPGVKILQSSPFQRIL